MATFSGTPEGKTVVELRYEAYIPMEICSSARSSWNSHSIAFAHRLGSVAFGETSVLSAVHRADALDACKFAIDEVWKENAEFIERRLAPGATREGLLCRTSGGLRHMVKHGCCGAKVKVADEGISVYHNQQKLRVR